MSCPLSSLGKVRKVPLNLPELRGHGKRIAYFEENSYTDDEAALLSEILPPLSWAHNSTSSAPSPSVRSKANDSTPGNSELMSMMTKRLTKMEQRVRSQAQEINRKNQQITMLEEKLSALQLSIKTTDESKRQLEEEKYLQLQNQVWEMEKFLNDYGMIWVGTQKEATSNVHLKEKLDLPENPDASGQVLYPGINGHSPAARESSEHQPQQSYVTELSESETEPIASPPRQASPQPEVLSYKLKSAPEENAVIQQDDQTSTLAFSLEEPVMKGIQKLERNMNSVIQEVSSDATIDPFQMDFDLVLQNLKDLNILAGEGVAAVEHVTGGARLKRPDPIPLTLFKNGIMLFNGPFRSFSQPSTQQCMQDIMDGYFPSELQSRYPNGVPITVTDRRDEVYRNRRSYVEFPGVGQKVDGHHDHKSSNQQDLEFVTETSEVSGQKQSVEQFLNKLPKTVIRAGRVFDIQGEIRALLQAPPKASDECVTLIETPCLQALKERLEFREGTLPTSRNVSTLRIKSENGEKTYIIKMFFSETIGDLRAHLDQSRGEQQSDYDIISTFPQKVYSDQSKTLMEYGLVPNAALILRPQRFQILTQQQETVTPCKE